MTWFTSLYPLCNKEIVKWCDNHQWWVQISSLSTLQLLINHVTYQLMVNEMFFQLINSFVQYKWRCSFCTHHYIGLFKMYCLKYLFSGEQLSRISTVIVIFYLFCIFRASEVEKQLNLVKPGTNYLTRLLQAVHLK